MNSLHGNLKFTVEFGGDQLAFLDSEISIKNGNFETFVYRKPTNTGVILNNGAMCPFHWKVGLLKCLLYRAWTVCSNYSRLHSEFEKLRTVFVENGYSTVFYDKILKLFLWNRFKPKALDDSNVVEKSYVLMVPYVGKASLIFKRRLSELVRETYGVKLSCVFNSCKVKDYFSLKCPVNPFLLSNVVYKFSCKVDPTVFYIGETERHIGIRAGEHLDIKGNKSSSVKSHIMNCAGCMTSFNEGKLSYKDFEILKTGQSKYDIQVLEALAIKRLNPQINRQQFKSGANFTVRVFL